MSWILLATFAQFINAIVALIDKAIVSGEKRVLKPSVYAFYTCLISGVWIFVYGLNFIPGLNDIMPLPQLGRVMMPTLEVVALAFLSAYTFFTALVAMYSALKEHDASDVVPVIGAVSALGSFGLGYLFLNTPLTTNFTLGIVLLAAGTFLVSRLRFPFSTAMVALYAGMFFALHYVSLKGLFTVTSFDDGFFWSRIAMMFFALTLLMIPNYWERVRDQTKESTLVSQLLVFGNKVLAGVGTILILKATDLGDVAVVQALGGLQFVFILVLGILFSFTRPHLIKTEQYHADDILQKALFVAVISIGFLVLFR